MMCKLCERPLDNGDIEVGFGTGDGQDFVHGYCYDTFNNLALAMFGWGTLTTEKHDRAVAAFHFIRRFIHIFKD